MGGALTCLCLSSSKVGGVIVMKENGDLIKFRKGVVVKEILATYAGYKIVRCGSESSVLPNLTELETSRLYFLIPEELVLCDDTYDKFWRVAESRGLIRPKTRDRENDSMKVSDSDTISGQVMMGQVLLFEASSLRKSSWKPGLQTIPETVSPC